MTVLEGSFRINELAEAKNLSRYALAAQCPEVVRSTVYNALSAKQSMKLETLIYICEALQVSLRDFFDFDKKPEEIYSGEERLLINDYRKLDRDQKQRTFGYMQAMLEDNKRRK